MGRDRSTPRPDNPAPRGVNFRPALGGQFSTGLDRSVLGPESVPGRTDEARLELIAALSSAPDDGRGDRWCVLGMALSTVSGILTRIGLGKLSAAAAARAAEPLRALPLPAS